MRPDDIDLRRYVKLRPEKRDQIRDLWRSGKNAHQISKAAGVQYRTAWSWVKRLEAGDAP